MQEIKCAYVMFLFLLTDGNLLLGLVYVSLCIHNFSIKAENSFDNKSNQ